MADVNITMADKNLKFGMRKTSESRKDVEIERSSMDFVPPELFKQFGNVREFVARNASIKEIYADTFGDAPQLRYLILSSNQISELIDESFKNASALESLKLQHNQIATLHSHTFFGLTELRILILSHNQIAFLPLHLFRGLDSLDQLMLDNNRIRVLSQFQFQTNLNIHKLYFEDNNIVTIDEGTFGYSKFLEQVDLSENICVDKKFSPWRADNLTELDCCTKSFEEMEKCLAGKVKEADGAHFSSHLPLILFLFISFFGNFFALGYFVHYRNRNRLQMDAENIELFADQNGSAYQVY